MMSHFNKYIKRIVQDHHTVAFVGVMFIIMGLINFNDHFFEKLLGFDVKIGHGFILMGIFNVLLSLVFLINGISTVESTIKEKEEKTPSIEELQKKIDELESEIKILQKSYNKESNVK